MSEFEFEKRQIWKTAALALCVALVGLLAFLLWREEQKRAESQLLYEEMEEELRPLSVEMYDLENKLEELEKDYNSEQQGMGSLIFLFTDLDEIIYTDIFPQMQEYGFTGVLCLSADHIPGNEGCLTQPQLEELMAAGWECCLVWEEEMEYEEWASVCQEVEEAAGIETPDTVYTMADTYNRDLDRFFEEQGFSAVIHHGEEALPLVQTDLEEGIWHLGAVAWIQNGAGSLLASAASQGGNLVFTVGSDSELEQYEEESFASMLERVEDYCREDSLFVTDFSGEREYRREMESGVEELEKKWQEQKAEIESQIEELDEKMDAVTDKYLQNMKNEGETDAER